MQTADAETATAKTTATENREKNNRNNAWEPGYRSEADEKGAEDFLKKILGKIGLEHVDTGDILLLLILFFLFSEKGDEELMIALGLLLIL